MILIYDLSICESFYLRIPKKFIFISLSSLRRDIFAAIPVKLCKR